MNNFIIVEAICKVYSSIIYKQFCNLSIKISKIAKSKQKMINVEVKQNSSTQISIYLCCQALQICCLYCLD